MLSEGTIIALSTAAGSGAIGLIRISGEEAIGVTERLFYPRTKKKLHKQNSHTIHLGDIKEGHHIIDEVLVSLFKNPHSYTGEDVVEISCHGSRYIQEKSYNFLYKKESDLPNPESSPYGLLSMGKWIYRRRKLLLT